MYLPNVWTHQFKIVHVYIYTNKIMMTRGNERQIWRYQREVIRNRKSNGKMKKEKKKQRSTKHYIEIKKMCIFMGSH